MVRKVLKRALSLMIFVFFQNQTALAFVPSQQSTKLRLPLAYRINQPIGSLATNTNRIAFQSSRLFRSATPIKDKKHPLKESRRLVSLALPLLLVSIPTRAWAATATATTSSWSLQTLPWKRFFRACLSILILSEIISNIRVTRRQAKIATSEWRRYAQHPAARGRAIMSLIIQQTFFVLASKIVRFRRSSIRKYAGRQFANGLLKLGPLYIKLGQIVSCRKNLLGPEWIEAMARLQDGVPARTGQDAMELAYSTLDGGKEAFDKIFDEFDSTPLAAARYVPNIMLPEIYHDLDRICFHIALA